MPRDRFERSTDRLLYYVCDRWRGADISAIQQECGHLRAQGFAKPSINDLSVWLVAMCGYEPQHTSGSSQKIIHCIYAELSTCCASCQPACRRTKQGLEPLEGVPSRVISLHLLMAPAQIELRILKSLALFDDHGRADVQHL